MLALIAEVEERAEGKSIAEQELLVMEFGEQIQRMMMQDGISDGAVWIADLLGDLGVKRHILDVYHASTYFQTLMAGLGYPEQQRLEQRKALLRGRSTSSSGSTSTS